MTAIANQVVWGDGRTPTDGQVMGALALEAIALPGETFERYENYATVFKSRNRIIVGRFCGRDYLDKPNPGHLHWTKIARSQLLQLDQLDLLFSYLFVSPEIDSTRGRLWHVPVAIVKERVFPREPNKTQNDYDVVIKEENNLMYLYGKDISEYSSTFPT